MTNLFLTLACGDYDRTRAIRDGVVRPEGLELNYISLPAPELFWRMLVHEEFDVSEMSTSAYLLERSRGIDRFIAIPVFPSRVFRHSYVFINTNSGIKEPHDLIGKRVGVPEFHMTAVMWMRGIIENEYGVPTSSIHWKQGGQNEPGRKERVELHLPDNIDLEVIPEHLTLDQMLRDGEIDALLTASVPRAFLDGCPQVQRLWPNYKEVEQDFYRRTGIFPIMHTVVIKKAIYERHPWVARSLCKAFEEAKKICYAQMQQSGVMKYSLPWYRHELMETIKLFGEDFWPYGIEENRVTLETMTKYSVQQGLSARRLSIEELFAPNTLDQSKH